MKVCGRCRHELPLKCFTRRKNSKGEFVLHQGNCKRCRQDLLNDYRKNHSEIVRAANKRANDRGKQKKIEWVKAHPESRKKTAQRWRKNNLQYYAEATARRRIQKRGFEPYSRRFVYERDEGICWICDKPIEWGLHGWDPEAFTVDHVIPLSKEGPDTLDNVRAAHRRCNTKRNARVVVVKRRKVLV